MEHVCKVTMDRQLDPQTRPGVRADGSGAGEGRQFGQMPEQEKYATSAEKQSDHRRRREDLIPDTEPVWEAQPVVPPTPGDGRWRSMRAHALLILEQVASEMEIYHEGRPKSWWRSDRAEALLEVMESFALVAADLRNLQTL